jgi:hypothetical protein
MKGAVAAFLVIGAFATSGLLLGLALGSCRPPTVAECCLHDVARGIGRCWTVPATEACGFELELPAPSEPVEVWL